MLQTRKCACAHTHKTGWGEGVGGREKRETYTRAQKYTHIASNGGGGRERDIHT